MVDMMGPDRLNGGQVDAELYPLQPHMFSMRFPTAFLHWSARRQSARDMNHIRAKYSLRKPRCFDLAYTHHSRLGKPFTTHSCGY